MTARLRFHRRVRLMKGVWLNLGKTGITSLSVGTRGARYTVDRNGRRRATVGLPGSGLFFTDEWTAAPRGPIDPTGPTSITEPTELISQRRRDPSKLLPLTVIFWTVCALALGIALGWHS